MHSFELSMFSFEILVRRFNSSLPKIICCNGLLSKYEIDSVELSFSELSPPSIVVNLL